MREKLSSKVLLVEDDANIAELLKYHFRAAGFTVFETDDGLDAITMAEWRRPDAVVLDWSIPGLSGIHVCRMLRRATSTSNLTIVMLTARSGEEQRAAGINAGADDYIVKPFSPQKLVDRINFLVERRRQAPPSS